MEGGHSFLQNIALVCCVAALTTVVFHRLRQPVVFGYLLAGMIVGPHLPVPLVADEGTVRTMSELGVILLMFSLGLEFSLRRVISMAGTAGLAALTETSIMFGLGFLATRALGWPPMEATFTGAIVAVSSTTIIAKAFAEHGVGGRVREVVFGILVAEDLIAILLVAILTTLVAGGGISAGVLGRTGIRLVTFLIALIGVGGLIVPRLIRAVLRAGSPEMTLIASVGVSFAAALAALAFGYSVALGAFIAGSLVAESGHGPEIEKRVEPVRDLFLAIFFVSVGMFIDPRVLVEHWGAVVLVTLVVLVGKIIAVTAGAFLTGNGLRNSIQAGMSLAQIGEFSFIIAAVGTASGAIRPYLYPVAITASAITTLTTPWLIRAARPVAMAVDRNLPGPVQTFVALYGSWIERLGHSNENNNGGRARIRRLVRLLVLDALVIALLVVGTSLEMDRFTSIATTVLKWPDSMARLIVIAAAMAVAIPLVIGIVRMSWRLGFVLAVRALPSVHEGAVDFARAPRTALVVTLQIAILVAIIAPLTAVTQPFLRGTSIVAVLFVVIVLLAIAFWRAARDLHGHARAGAEVIASALASHMSGLPSPEQLSETMERVSAALPGLGEPTPVVLGASSSAVGRTLSEVNLRGLTGATVLCIFRAEGDSPRTVVPTGRERLRAGDVLALAGTHDALDAAREILG